ncbi:MAG: hypothetical protein JNK02_08305 [Planctomycetes bacterium]|nr:hypothetical protein [Planctomycetota bacterium]
MLAVLAAAFTLQGAADLAALEKRLRASDDRERQTAVQELARLGTKDAWLLVVGALKDVSARVADEAEIQLAKADDPAVAVELMGKAGLQSSDPWVAIHAAGALTSMRAPSGPALLAGLSARSDEAREVLLAGLERAAREGRFTQPSAAFTKALEKSLAPGPKAGTTHAAALLALAALEPGRVPGWIAAADARSSAPQLAALLALAGPERTPDAAKLLELGAAHVERSVRAQTVAALAAHPDAERLARLAAMMAVEPNARLFWTIDAHLERLSGLSGGGKPEFWQGWAAKLGPEWKPATGVTRRYAPAGDTEAPKLVGLPIQSTRLAILIDLSGSTWEVRADGRTRKQRLDEELEKALRALPEHARFNLIPYTNDPLPWEKRLQPATAANVARATAYFQGCKATGKGNVWDAAMLALADPEVDTLLVLTDGAPTGGRRWNLDLMRERFLEQNRFRHVVLDAVLVDASKLLREKWEAWCAATGGRALAVKLDG